MVEMRRNLEGAAVSNTEEAHDHLCIYTDSASKSDLTDSVETCVSVSIIRREQSYWRHAHENILEAQKWMEPRLSPP